MFCFVVQSESTMEMRTINFSLLPLGAKTNKPAWKYKGAICAPVFCSSGPILGASSTFSSLACPSSPSARSTYLPGGNMPVFGRHILKGSNL